MSQFLLESCQKCLADKGIKDDGLVQKVYEFIHTEFEEKNKGWSIATIEGVIAAFDSDEEKNIEFRDMDGVYFRIHRNNKWQNICFSDLTEEEMDEVIKGRNEEWLRSLCKILGKTLRDIGDQLDIRAYEAEEEV